MRKRMMTAATGIFKVCLACGANTDLADYGPNKLKADGRNDKCRTCTSALDKAWRIRVESNMDISHSVGKQLKKYHGRIEKVTELLRKDRYPQIPLWGKQEMPVRWLSDRVVLLSVATLTMSPAKIVSMIYQELEKRAFPEATNKRKLQIVRRYTDLETLKLARGKRIWKSRKSVA